MSLFPSEQQELEAALAASQADITRLAAELAESVRALAVSQGEVAAMRERVRAARLQASHLACDLERARGHATDIEKALRGVMTFYVPVDHAPGCECQWCVGAFMLRLCDARSEAAPPAPASSPEPDRASPEVTVEENDR